MLLLFDIDGTLMLEASAEHRDAIHAAIREVHGVDVPDGRVEAAGRTDLDIARSILELAGLDSGRIDERVEDLGRAACRHFTRLAADDMRAFVAPGVPEALEALADRDGVIMSLVTGNLEPIARAKLRAARLGHLFAEGQGGFGSDAEDRRQLPAVARARAGAPGEPYPRERTVVIGDTPRDIACARADGVHVLAVATGPFPAEALREADAVVERATDIPAALDALPAFS